MPTLQYVQPTEGQKELMQKFRDKYETLLNDINGMEINQSRGLSLAKTKLEESAMWLNKAITENDQQVKKQFIEKWSRVKGKIL